MKKLVKQTDGSYSLEEVGNVLGQVLLIAGAPFTGLAGQAHAGGQARANTLVSLVLGAGLGATIAYPLIRKSMSVVSGGRADEWLAETHASNQKAQSGAGSSLF